MKPQKQCRSLCSCPLSSGSPLSGGVCTHEYPDTDTHMHMCECGLYSSLSGPTPYPCPHLCQRREEQFSKGPEDPQVDPGKGVFPTSVSGSVGDKGWRGARRPAHLVWGWLGSQTAGLHLDFPVLIHDSPHPASHVSREAEHRCSAGLHKLSHMYVHGKRHQDGE